MNERLFGAVFFCRSNLWNIFSSQLKGPAATGLFDLLLAEFFCTFYGRFNWLNRWEIYLKIKKY